MVPLMLNEGFDDEGWNEELKCTLDERLALRKTFFGTVEGMETFKWLMHNLKVMKPIGEDQDVALQRYGHKILSVMGLSEVDSHDKIFEYYKVIAEEDVVDPRKINAMRRTMNVGQPDC